MRLAAFALVTLISLHGGPAAAIEHTFVAVSGAADTGDCTRSQPCATVYYASGKTNVGGVLTILDEGDFGPLSIPNSITIEGQGPGTRIWNPNATALVVNDGLRLVLRNLSIGADFTSFGVIGIYFVGTSLRLENVTISNQTGGAARGVYFAPSAGGILEMRNVMIDYTGNGSTGAAVLIDTAANTTSRVEISDSSFNSLSNGIVVKGSGNVQLSVSDTTIAHANKDGIYISPSGGTTRLVIQNSKVVNNGGTGVLIAPTGGAKVNTTVIGSGMDGNVIGIRSFPAGTAASNLSISDTSASNNAGGVHASGKSTVGIIRGNVSGNSSYGIAAVNPAAVRVGSSMVNGNTLGLSGPVSSYGNNQLLGNTTQGSATAVSPAGAP